MATATKTVRKSARKVAKKRAVKKSAKKTSRKKSLKAASASGSGSPATRKKQRGIARPKWAGDEDYGQHEGDDLDPRGSYSGSSRPRKGRLSEAILDPSNPDAGTEFDDRFFKSIESAGALDLPLGMLQKAQRISVLLHRKNVRAYNAIELVMNFVLGSGVVIKAADPKVQAVLDDHWEINEWDEKSEERLRSLALFGEQLYAVSVDDDGLVELTSFSPFQIRKILRDKDDSEKLIAVRTGTTAATGVVQQEQDKGIRDFVLLRPRVEFDPKKEHAFYFAVNRISGATRGVPDLFPSIDWLEGLDGFVFSLLERADISQDVVFDLTFEGLQTNELALENRRFRKALRAGGVWTHNEKAELKIINPTLGTSDAKIAVEILLKQIQAGTGLSGLFYGDSQDLTRASASELSVPVAKKIEQRQSFFRRMLRKILNFQIERSAAAGKLNGVEDLTYFIEMPPVFLRDLKTVSDAMESLGRALQAGVAEGWIDNGQAGQIYRKALLQLGIGDRPRTQTKEDSEPSRSEIEAMDIAQRAHGELIAGKRNVDGNGQTDGADRPGDANRAGLRTGAKAPEKS